MLKLALRLSLVLIGGNAVLMLVALVIGSAQNPYVIATQLDSNFSMMPEETVYHPQITLIDINRALQLEYRLPLDRILSIDFRYGYDRVHLMVERETSVTEPQGVMFFRYNLHTQQLVNIPLDPLTLTFPYEYDIRTSPNGRRLAYSVTDGTNNDLYILDITTRIRRVIKTEPTNGGASSIIPYNAWSPDENYLAAYIFSPDGNNLLIHDWQTGDTREFPRVSQAHTNLRWSPDRHYILLNPDTYSRNVPISILSVYDGSPHPYTDDLEVLNFNWWDCGKGQWLTYVRVNDTYPGGRLLEGYLLNMNTGKQVRVNDHPLLKDVSVDKLRPSADCQHIVIEGIPHSVHNAYPTAPTANYLVALLRAIYVLDPWRDITAQDSVRLIDSSAALLWSTDQSATDFLLFEKYDETNDRIQLYRRTLLPDVLPQRIGAYTLTTHSKVWTGGEQFMVYLEDRSPHMGNFGSQIHVFDLRNGITRTFMHAYQFTSYYTLRRWRSES